MFESIRKNKEKGGSMLGVHVGLQPVLIQEYNDTFELIVVEVKVADRDVRVISGYGPQENWDLEERTPFYNSLEEEISAAELQGRSVIIAMDANAKLGPELVPGDPYEKSPNGSLLSVIMERHALCVVNGTVEKREGLITREKRTTLGLKQSVIDFVIVSSDLIEHIESIHVDEKRIHVLTKNVKNKNGLECIQSDHNLIQTMLRLRWSPQECKVVEVFKYNDKEAKEKFKKLTTDTKQLSSIVDKDKPLDIVTKQLLKRINGFVHECFSKVKLTDKPNKDLERLYNKRTVLRTKSDAESKKQLESVESELCKKYSEVMFQKIMTEVKGMEDSEDGGFNSGRLWKLKKKLSPKVSDPPTVNS